MKSILIRSVLLLLSLSHRSLGFWEPDWENNFNFLSCFTNLRFKPVAINIDTKTVQKVSTETPMEITATEYDSTILFNTGQSIQTTNTMENIGNATGGLLQGTFIRLGWTYYWTKSAHDRNVGTTINGNGYPFEVRVLWRNSKYLTVAEAVKHPDGLMELLFVYEMCPTTCQPFNLVTEGIKRIKKAGWFTKVPTSVHIDASNFISPENEYYTYMGSFIDTTTNHRYRSSRVIFPKPNAQYCITSKQFTETFSDVKNFCGASYVNTLPHDSRPTQVSLVKGIIQNLHSCG